MLPRSLRALTTIAFLTASLAGSVGCTGDDGDDDDETPPGPGLTWAVGSYYGPGYISDGYEAPPQFLDFAYDGTWSHTTDGFLDDEGRWSSDTYGVIDLDNGKRIETTPNCRNFVYQNTSYFRDERVWACSIPSLTGLEYCLVGTYGYIFEDESSTAYFELTYTDDRMYVLSSIYESTDDYDVFTGFDYWQVVDGELVYADGTRETMDAAFWADLEAARTSDSPRSPFCDETLLPGADCGLSCNSGYDCVEHDDWEMCCRPEFPNGCADLHLCWADAADRDAACATSYYGDPAYDCEGNQRWLTASGRDFCAPICAAGSGSCPSASDGTDGTCLGALDDGTEVCGLVCSDLGVVGGQCPGQMTCVANGASGLCAW